ncbi:uncharacterized protein LOC132385096 isoform X2 [Hypanus sabinus]|uniref:uncharacterized protein LOC132385096 isoform X2 n=1 Tax=Hypanus sabinus TaxID=79690 RepID=UPI0028C45B56|nr:uncharacterized protein LOC132385096 isoform X2 [Hypanus sabinus]
MLLDQQLGVKNSNPSHQSRVASSTLNPAQMESMLRGWPDLDLNSGAFTPDSSADADYHAGLQEFRVLRLYPTSELLINRKSWPGCPGCRTIWPACWRSWTRCRLCCCLLLEGIKVGMRRWRAV